MLCSLRLLLRIATHSELRSRVVWSRLGILIKDDQVIKHLARSCQTSNGRHLRMIHNVFTGFPVQSCCLELGVDWQTVLSASIWEANIVQSLTSVLN